MAASKHDKNCPITFIPSITFLRRHSARKSIIGKISFFTGKLGAEIDKLVISIVLSDIFFISVVLPYKPPFNNKPEKESLQSVKGKLIQLLESVLSVSYVTSTKAAKILFEKWKRNDAQMKSQINDAWNRQVI